MIKLCMERCRECTRLALLFDSSVIREFGVIFANNET